MQKGSRPGSLFVGTDYQQDIMQQIDGYVTSNNIIQNLMLLHQPWVPPSITMVIIIIDTHNIDHPSGASV